MLEELGNTDKLTTTKLINKLESQEQRASMREGLFSERALFYFHVKTKTGTDNQSNRSDETNKKRPACQNQSK